MAPKRKSPATAAAAAAPTMPSRITRSMAAGKEAAVALAKKEEPEAVLVRAPAPAGQKGRKKAKKEEAAVVEEDVGALLSPPVAAKQKGKKNAKKEVVAAPAAAKEEAAVVEEDVGALLSPPVAAKQKGKKNAKKEVMAAPAAAKEEDDGAVIEDGKRVVVEACTQCQQFKKRAAKVKEDLESAVPGVSVVINPAKPRRGCLEIREEGGEVFISLLDMPRPFKKMRALDMDKVIQDIVKKIS
ncbi:unnamed protein product [Alopecurus aequalis]